MNTKTLNRAAAALGRRGGLRRRELPPEERIRLARHAAIEGWKKRKKPTPTS